MLGYLSGSACQGRRPNHLASRRHIPRPNLIAKLLRDRQVARFLVAPSGFGKSGLALEYAEVIFSFKHVFWLNGKSPCFLRDLDSNVIASTLCELDDQPFLLVVEDVPLLDTPRALLFSETLDAILERGCEVLVTCVPSSDAFVTLQSDRVRLSAQDMLLSDAEMDVARSSDERDSRPASTIPVSGRVPALQWGVEDNARSFLIGVMGEELPADILLTAATMLVLCDGVVADVGVFGSCGNDSLEMLAVNYPYLGIDQRTEYFSSSVFSAQDIARALSGKLSALAQCSLFPDGDTLVQRWADVLVARMSGKRACELVGALCSRDARIAWLTKQSRTLLKQNCILPAHQFYQSLRLTASSSNSSLELEEALRLLVLGNTAAALLRARRIAFDLAVAEDLRALAALILYRHGKSDTVSQKAYSELERLSGVTGGDVGECNKVVHEGFSSVEAFWKSLALAQVMLARDPFSLSQEWEAWLESGASSEALALISYWVLAGAMPNAKDSCMLGVRANDERIVCVARFVQEHFDKVRTENLDFFSFAAGLALEHAREEGIVSAVYPLSASSALELHSMEMEILSQRRSFDRAAKEHEEQRVEYAATHPDAFMDGRRMPPRSAGATIEPLLSVNLFGGLDVCVGGEHIDAKNFRRQKIKTLLALLVLNRGREFPRDRLVSILWPESDLASARKNFYSIWSQLRRALSLPSSACPYLIRHQNGCRLEERLLITDMARFDSVCRMLLFGQPGADGWSKLYAEINEAFVDEILPSETENEFIIQARMECRMQLVDALVAAANRLVTSEVSQEGLWFARAALRRDRTREDAYTALMRAQIAAGQRTAALETYFTCRRVLTSELGLDPSVKTVALYRSIIETEEDLD